jgi:hypothetical protein
LKICKEKEALKILGQNGKNIMKNILRKMTE